MKNVVLILISLLFLNASATVLKGGISEDNIPKGFFGSWGVISKIINTTNPELFNKQSKDIWTLSGYSNVLILENLESGAHSRIEVDKTSSENVLKFKRKKVVENKKEKIIYIETVCFTLNGNNFSGSDDFIVEKYENNKLISKDSAKYRVEGVKISGVAPN